MALEKLGVRAVVEGLSRFTRDLKKMDKSIEDVGDASTKTGRLSDNLAQNWTKLAAVAGSLGAAIFAVKKYFDFAEEGAQLLRLEQAGESLAKSFGTSMNELVDAVDEAARGTVARADIIQAANRAMLLGVADSAEEMAQLMEVAAVRGKAMGLSTTQAFNDIVTGIGRASPMILDNLGIVTGGEKVYVDFAESIGKAKDELTEVEKKQALLNAVLDSSAGMLEDAKKQADDLATSYEKLHANIKNFTDSLKIRLATELTGTIDILNDYFDTQEMITFATNRWGVRKKLFLNDFVYEGKVIAKNIEELRDWIDAQLKAEDAERKRIESYVVLNDQIVKRMEAEDESLQTLEEATEAHEELRKEQERLAEVAIEEKFRNLKDLMKVDLTESFVDFQGKVGDLRGEIAELEGMDYLTDEQKTQLEESREELDKTIKKWRDYTAQIIFNIATQALEREGLTEEEAIALAKTAEGLGLVDEGYAALTEKIYEDAEALEEVGDQSDIFAEAMERTIKVLSDATIEAENLDNAIRGIPTTKEISILMEVEQIGFERIEELPMFEGMRIPRQHGGPVARGMPYLVGERGPELFIPSISGNVLSNMMTRAMGQINPSITNTQTSYGDNLNLNIYTSAPTEDIVADFRMMKSLGSRI